MENIDQTRDKFDNLTQTLSIINPNNSKMTDYDNESSLTQTEEDDSGATTYERCSTPNYEVSTP